MANGLTTVVDHLGMIKVFVFVPGILVGGVLGGCGRLRQQGLVGRPPRLRQQKGIVLEFLKGGVVEIIQNIVAKLVVEIHASWRWVCAQMHGFSTR
jgi:hypothetical protein